MISGIYQLIDGCLVHDLRYETVANNLANQNTNAFKKDIISFNQTLTMNYVSETDFEPGPVRYTGNELDVALAGKGFFKIQTSAGVRYSRDGAFTINAQGELTTPKGDAVLGQNGPLKIEGKTVAFKNDGQVFVDGAAVDRLAVVDFESPQLLRKEGNGYYVHQGEDSGISNVQKVDLKQGYLESSNVNPTEEMIQMLEAFRAFESAQKAIQSIDELTSKMINDQGLL